MSKDTYRDDSTVTRANLPSTEPERETFLSILHCPVAEAIGRRFFLPPERTPKAFGRDIPEQGPPIPDPCMSRLHFRISFDIHTGSFRLGDANSRNGTWVNGERVEHRELTEGDMIRSGETLLLMESMNPMAELTEVAARAATSRFAVLLCGETGVGKERMAQLLHEKSGRTGPFVAVNCATIPKDLLGSELFGHVRGAFSGAGASREGLIARANGGTLFLDEVADLPLEQQPSLLRVLQESLVRPIGADREIPVDLRVVSATNMDLEHAIQSSKFREDLYARLAHLVLHIPPLRMRRSEVLPIAREIIALSGREIDFDTDAAEALLLWHWPRNIRELQALIHSLSIFSEKPQISLKELAAVAPRVAEPIMVRKGLQMSPANEDSAPSLPSSRQALRDLLAQHRGNLAEVARTLGTHRTQLYRLLEKHALNPDDFR